MEVQRTQTANALLRKENKVGGLMPLDFSLHYKAVIVKQYGTRTQTRRLTARSRKPRNQPMPMWLINLRQWVEEYARGKRQSLQ